MTRSKRPSTAAPLQVLIVEDETLVGMGLRAQLEKLGHKVIGQAASALEAKAMFERDQPDLVLLDIRLGPTAQGEASRPAGPRSLGQEFSAKDGSWGPLLRATAPGEADAPGRMGQGLSPAGGPPPAKDGGREPLPRSLGQGPLSEAFDADGIDLASELLRERRCPMIIISAYSDRNLIERASAAGVFGYLIKPVNEKALEAQIEVSLRRFNEQEELRVEKEKLAADLETRKLMDRAKAVLMKRANLPEDEAHRRLQQESQKRRISMADLCRRIIDSDEVMG